jgi:hypothetical protein
VHPKVINLSNTDYVYDADPRSQSGMLKRLSIFLGQNIENLFQPSGILASIHQWFVNFLIGNLRAYGGCLDSKGDERRGIAAISFGEVPSNL